MAREARLKAEYADEYPGITPEVWMPGMVLNRGWRSTDDLQATVGLAKESTGRV
jgi:hypothetical protein